MVVHSYFGRDHHRTKRDSSESLTALLLRCTLASLHKHALYVTMDAELDRMQSSAAPIPADVPGIQGEVTRTNNNTQSEHTSKGLLDYILAYTRSDTTDSIICKPFPNREYLVLSIARAATTWTRFSHYLVST